MTVVVVVVAAVVVVPGEAEFRECSRKVRERPESFAAATNFRNGSVLGGKVGNRGLEIVRIEI